MSLFAGFIFSVAAAQDLKKDTALGRQVFELVEESMGFYHRPELEAYITRIGQRLVSKLDHPLFPFEFYLADSPEPNSFAAPGGKVFVTRGLLALPLREDELACVIAHEIIHSQYRHYIKRQRSSLLGAIVALPGLLLGSIFQGPIGEAVASPFVGAGLLINAQYSQGDEMEADRRGIALAAMAGYDPYALSAFLNRMEAETEFLTGVQEKKGYLSTHPATTKRTRQIRQEGQQLKPAEEPPIAAPIALLQELDSIPLGANPEYGFKDGNTLYCPRFPLRIDSLPGWQYTFTPSSLGLVSEKDEALLILNSEEDSLDANAYLANMERQLRKLIRRAPDAQNEIRWEGNSGSMIEYSAAIGGKAFFVQFYAIDYNGKLLKIVTAAYLDKKEELDRVMATLKTVTREALPDARQTLLQVSVANAGETVEGFASRMHAADEIKIICLLNDRSRVETLKGGEWLKWPLKRNYTFKKQGE
jgi:predicted Zn-dependent protease